VAVSIAFHALIALLPLGEGFIDDAGHNGQERSVNRLSATLVRNSTPLQKRVAGSTKVLANLATGTVGSLSTQALGTASQDVPTSAIGIALLADQYLPAEDLSRQPEALSEPSPISIPWTGEQTGRLVMTVFIDQTGKVDKIEVESATNIPKAFLPIIPRRFMGIRFTPGVVDDLPVPSKIQLEVVIGNED
jgi:hypothetical protein